MRFSLRRLKILGLLIAGGLSSYVWLVNTFQAPTGIPPGTAEYVELGRVLRVVSPLSVLPFVFRRLPLFLRRRPPPLGLVVLALIAWPTFSIVAFPNSAFIISVYGPVVMGASGLLCLCFLKREEFRYWLAGVGIVALGFFLAGIYLYGFEQLTVFGRPRAHFGFVHPAQTANAIVAASVGGVALILWFIRERLLRGTILLCWGVFVAVTLVLAQSINTLLFVGVIFVSWLVGGVLRPRILRILFGCALLMLPVAFYSLSIFGSPGNAGWQWLNRFSSMRLEVYRELFYVNLSSESLLSIVAGPTENLRMVYQEGYIRGLAALDSIYLTFLLSFGIVGMIGLIAVLAVACWELSRREHRLAYAALCGVAVFFVFDAQGITPSNLVIFTAITYALRQAAARPRRAAVQERAGSWWGAGVDTPLRHEH